MIDGLPQSICASHSSADDAADRLDSRHTEDLRLRLDLDPLQKVLAPDPVPRGPRSRSLKRGGSALNKLTGA